jgi:hypothetical protein
MQEFTTVSSSSYDPSALAAKLNDKSAEGWSVVSIVSTGGDVTAFLSRDSSGQAAAEPESVTPLADSEPEPAAHPLAGYEPMVPESPAVSAPVSEPSGWAVAPESSSSSSTSSSSAPSIDPSPSLSPSSSSSSSSYSPAPTSTYTPAPAAAPAATPAVPAGWDADPAGRFELRYWDGSTWTEHVSRAGQQFTDPPVA